MIGKSLAHYKILEKIGSGGMGEVYLAEDTKLDRKVALKILPPELAGSEERRARFKREAKAIAALNYPNIVTVYSVEESDSLHFITNMRTGNRDLFIVPAAGGAANQLIVHPANDMMPQWSPNGQSFFFKGIGPREGSLWQHNVTTGKDRKVADLLGRRGRRGRGLSTDGDHLYFTWEADLGDIWVMDVG